jgi:hypothetical protein
MRLGRGVSHSSPARAEIKNEWSYTSVLEITGFYLISPMYKLETRTHNRSFMYLSGYFISEN